MKKALAIDVGGTKIYSAIVNENGKIISDVEKYLFEWEKHQDLKWKIEFIKMFK